MNSSDLSSSNTALSTSLPMQPAQDSQTNICFNCGSSNYKVLYDAHDFDTGTTLFPLVRCQDCALSYTLCIDSETLTAAYSKDYYGAADAKFFGIIEALIRRGHNQQAKKILTLHALCQSKQIRAKQTGAKQDQLKVLDIGCGRALLLQEFQKLGTHCTGIERDEFPSSSNHKIEFIVGSLGDPKLADRTFDIIVIWHVLEHITELGSLLREFRKHLKPGGLLVISVPNFSSWQSHFFKSHWFHLDLPRHVSHFERNWLINTLLDLGFSITEQSSFTPSQNIFGFIQSTLNKLATNTPNRLYKLLMRRQGWQDWLALLLWSGLATLLLPAAIIEAFISEKSLQGATLTLYARYDSSDEISTPTNTKR